MKSPQRDSRKPGPRKKAQTPGGNKKRKEEPNQLKRAFLANTRHELRTPLNAIIGYCEILIEDAEDMGQNDLIPALHTIHDSGRQLLFFVNDILDPRKIGSSLKKKDLRDLGATLRRELRAPLNTIISYSEMLIEDTEVMGQKDVMPDLRHIRTAADRFLALIHNIDKITETTPGTRGTETFDSSSMIHSATSSVHQAEENEPSVASAYTGSLLVVDDNETNRDLLKRHLERQNHAVTTAENGREALEIMKTNVFDLVFLDVVMPEMGGYEVLQQLKSHEDWRNIPVIMISALDEMDSVVRCIETGAEDYLRKPFNPVLLKARTGACLEKKRLRDLEVEQKRQLTEINKALEVRNRFIQKTFGRYLSDEVVHRILETPEGLKLGGEKRDVTILMADLRGFTSISEYVKPETVVDTLTIYFETMTDIIFKYQGTIKEFIGDAIDVIFGAPISRDDDARRAVACAIEMQLAMSGVNERLRRAGNPELAMGIGINTGSAVVGNIGSEKRTAYGVVGRNVNLTSRIESFTVGGQIFISESTLEACGPILRIDDEMEIMAKGVTGMIRIYEVGGIHGDYNLFLPEKKKVELHELKEALAVRFTILAGKHVYEDAYTGRMIRLRENVAEIQADVAPHRFENIKLFLFNDQGEEISANLYAKVVACLSASPPIFRIHFTSIPPDAGAFLEMFRTS